MSDVTHRVAVNVASMYLKPDASSEQVSQIIWGAPAAVLTDELDFTYVEGEDGYRGWIRTKQICPAKDDLDSPISTVATLFAELYTEPDAKSEISTRLTVGARLALGRQKRAEKFVTVVKPDGGAGYIHESQISATYEPLGISNLVQHLDATRVVQKLLDNVVTSSRYFIGTPYVWGGTTPFGMDCSGFTQLVYKINGLQLLRDSGEQWIDRRFETVYSANSLDCSEIEPADLLFFGRTVDSSYNITHVGLALGDGRFVHSVGKGRGNIVSSCSEQEFMSTYAGARRLKPSLDLTLSFAR